VKRLQTTIEVAASLIAVAAYVYLLGGLVVWLRFTAARLQTDDAVRALDSQRLFVTGMKALLVVALILAVVLGAVWLAWKAVRLITFTRSAQEAAAPGTAERAEETWKAWILVLQAVIAGVVTASLLVGTPAADSSLRLGLLALMLAGVWVIVVSLTFRTIDDGRIGDMFRRLALIAMTLFVAAIAVWRLAAPLGIAVLVLLALLHLSRRMAKLPSVKEPSKLVPAVLVLAGGLSLVVVAYMATPPVQLDRTAVTLNGKKGTITGGYVGQNSEGVFLATCEPDPQDPWISHATRLVVIPPSGFQRVTVGGTGYAFDYGKDPSLLDLAIYAFERDKVEELTDTVELDARGRKLVCGQLHRNLNAR
jgi:hypothetical protein